MLDAFFAGWPGVLRTLVVGVFAYVALVAILRIAGKRTLAKMNAFDFVVTVALGSTLATILLNKDVALVEGVVALALLVVLQMVVAFLSVRSPVVAALVKSEPTLIVRGGEMLRDAMRRERVAAREVEQAARQSGIAKVDEVDAMILETDGSFSVVPVVPGSHSGINPEGPAHPTT